MIVVISGVQLKHCVDPFVLEEGLDLFRVLADASQDRVPGLALFISQRKVHVVRQTLWLMGENVLLYSGKPERTGYATNP